MMLCRIIFFFVFSGDDIMGLIGATNSLPQSTGGADTIFLTNQTGDELSIGQKVLYKLGSVGSDTPTSFSYSANRICPPLVFDDNSFVTTVSDTQGALYSKKDGVWTASTASQYANWGVGGVYQYFDNGIVSEVRGVITDTGYTGGAGYIYQKSGKTTLPARSGYLGSFNGTDYCFSGFNYDNCTICPYNRDANTLGTSVFNLNAKYFYFGQIYGDKCLLDANKGNGYKILSISDGNTFTLLNSGILSGVYIIGATGLNVGAYVFATDALKNGYEYPNNTTYPHLFCYQVQDDYSLKLVSVPELKRFETTPCYACYDNRSQILAIGTADNVYFYQYGELGRPVNFVAIDAVLDNLPQNNGNIPYRVMMTPDKSTAIVQGEGTYVNVYRLSEAYHRIVPNTADNYDVFSAFTGFITGTTDANGKYEVKTVLPLVVESTITTDLEPDEVIVNGGAKS